MCSVWTAIVKLRNDNIIWCSNETLMLFGVGCNRMTEKYILHIAKLCALIKYAWEKLNNKVKMKKKEMNY